MANAIDGPPGAEAHATAQTEHQFFSTQPVGNVGVSPVGLALDNYKSGNDRDATRVMPAIGATRVMHAIQDRTQQPRSLRLRAMSWAVRVSPRSRKLVRELQRPDNPDLALAHAQGTVPSAALTATARLQAPPLDAPPLDAPGVDAPPATNPPLGKLPAGNPPPGAPLAPLPQLEVPAAADASTRALPGATRVPGGQILPVPPRDDEKYSYVRRNAWLLTVFGAASFPLLLFSQVRLMLEYHWFWIYSPCVVLATLFLALPILTDGFGRGFNFEEHKRLVDAWRPERYPSVDVFLPVCGEPIDILRNTWKYVQLMSRHYEGTVTPYVLDDSHSPDIKEMAREFGFAYATRPNRGWFKKSGNLWFGFLVSYGQYILLLDADFAPRHDFLNEALPYMEAYQNIGIVQTPQFFRITDDQNWIERGAGAVQELFYRSIQTARARKGGSICVGSCAVYRRKALAANLGMTLAEHSEDVLTGFDLNAIGWRLHYLPVNLSTGNCPDNVLAFLNQQYRWCSGTVGLLFGKRFWGAKLPLYSRLCYMSGLVYYIYTALFTFVVPALTITILAFLPNVLLLRNMIFMAPVLIYSAVIIPRWHKAPFRLEAWSVRVIAGWAHLFAYWDASRGKRLGWNPSGGNKKKQDGRRRFWACFLIWTVGSALVWTGLAMWRMMTMNPYNFIVLFALGLFELLVAFRVILQPAADGPS